MTRWSVGILWVLGVALASPAVAQEPPAKGPADIINRAREGAAQKGMEDAARAGEQAGERAGEQAGEQAAPPGDGTPADADAMAEAHGDVDPAALRRIMGQGESLAAAQATDALPAGTVRVRVVDGDGQAIPGQEVRLGIMVAEGGRRSETGVTDDEGVARFDGLPTGGDQSYRASVSYQGARYGASPFQLPPDRGYDVRLTRLPVTDQARVLLQLMGQTIVEIREQRLHVTQQAQLTNMGDHTYVFPPEGHEVRLPSGFTAFQSQPVMSDQRLSPTDSGFRVHGSLPPGPVTLMWAFDLPIQGTAMDFDVQVPWRTYVYRVVADAVPGMALDVEGMPPARPMDTESGKLLVTQTERRPEQPPLDRITVRLSGIPGAGPWRMWAVGGAVAFLLLGVFLALRGGRDVEGEARAREHRKGQLLAEAVELDKMRASDEIGPAYHQRRMEAVVDELAAILKLEERDRGTQPQAAATDKPATR
jgi:hypothetical protein